MFLLRQLWRKYVDNEIVFSTHSILIEPLLSNKEDELWYFERKKWLDDVNITYSGKKTDTHGKNILPVYLQMVIFW